MSKSVLVPVVLCLLCAPLPLAAQSGAPAAGADRSSSGATAPIGNEAVAFTRKDDTIQIVIGGKSFSVYNFNPAIAKPFLEALRTANGIEVTRSFPIGNTFPTGKQYDHPHQRALYFAHGDINGYDFWGEQAFSKFYHFNGPHPFGRTVFRQMEEMKGGPNSGVIRARFDMVGPNGKPFGEEIQQYTFRGTSTLRIVDCEFIFRANHGPIHFGDTKEGTFAIRRAAALKVPPGTMMDSKGRHNEAGIWGKRADWVDSDGVIDGHEVGVAIFDNPKNFRHPTYWMARDYGLLAANPFGLSTFLHNPKVNGGHTIPSGQSMTFRYRVLVHEGDTKQAHVAEQYRRYAAGK